MSSIPVDPIDFLRDGPDSELFRALSESIEEVTKFIVGSPFLKDANVDNRSIQDTSTVFCISLIEGGAELRFSQFGKMVTITNLNQITADDEDLIIGILKKYGFIYCSEKLLKVPYNKRYEAGISGDWFERYFWYQ